MKGKTIRTLLISATITAVTLTGCNSNDETLTTKNETATEEASTTEVETATTEEETTTIEETTTESETTTEVETSTEEETATIEETTTEEETSTDEETSTSNSDDAATRRANYKSKYTQDYNAKYDIYSWLDDDGDGVITDEEAAYLEDALDEMFSSKETSDSTTSSSSSSSSSSTLDIGTPFDDTVPVTQDISTMDDTGYATDLIIH
jgi:uncharacterized protein YcfL